jgi:antitoxin component HigA of HigAB toxin-antitoxin module
MAASESNCISSGWPIFTNIVTFIIGISVNRLFNNKMANRKEDRDLIDAIVTLVGDIENKAYIYYRLPVDDPDAIRTAAEIRSLNSQIGRQVQVFSNRFLKSNVYGHVARLRQAITLDNFDSSTRVQLSGEEPIFDDISRHCRMLLGDLDLRFKREYRP